MKISCTGIVTLMDRGSLTQFVIFDILSAHWHSHDDFFQPFVSSAKQHMYVSESTPSKEGCVGKKEGGHD